VRRADPPAPRRSDESAVCHFVLVASRFGTVGIVWQGARTPRVLRVLLPGGRRAIRTAITRLFPASTSRTCPAIARLAEGIRRLLRGEPADFDPALLALDRCSRFQRRVLLAERRIPRGRVSTYAAIARRLGAPGAARAVGQALANNPFPLLIPCHRAIRSDGTLGGFQGGIRMKRTLLAMECVRFAPDGRVDAGCLWQEPFTNRA